MHSHKSQYANFLVLNRLCNDHEHCKFFAIMKQPRLLSLILCPIHMKMGSGKVMYELSQKNAKISYL